MKKTYFMVIIATMAFQACGPKAYRLKKDVTKKAYLQIDGSKTRNSSNTTVNLYKFVNCDKDMKYLGWFRVSGNKSSKKPVELAAGELITVNFDRFKPGGFSSPGRVTRFPAHFVPREGHTYTFQYNNLEKGFEDVKFFDDDGKTKQEMKELLDEPSKICEKERTLKNKDTN